MVNKKPQETTIPVPGKEDVVPECNASLIIIKRIWIKPGDVDIRQHVKDKLKGSLTKAADKLNNDLLPILKVVQNGEVIVLPSQHPSIGVADDV